MVTLASSIPYMRVRQNEDLITYQNINIGIPKTGPTTFSDLYSI